MPALKTLMAQSMIFEFALISEMMIGSLTPALPRTLQLRLLSTTPALCTDSCAMILIPCALILQSWGQRLHTYAYWKSLGLFIGPSKERKMR